MKRSFDKMFSRVLYFFLYFVTCGPLEAVRNRSRARSSQVEGEEGGDIQLDPIAEPEEQHSYEPGSSQSGTRSRRALIYDVNMEHRVRVTRCGCWFPRNRIVPIFPLAAEKGAAGIYAVKSEGSRRRDDSSNDRSAETSNKHIVLGFAETKDEFSARKNSALALQSFATCARLNANYMRKVAWAPTDDENDSGEGCSSDSQGARPSKTSFSSKISFAWNVLRKRVSGARAEAVRAPTENKGNEASTIFKRKSKKHQDDFRSTQEKSKHKNRGAQKLFRTGESKKTASDPSKSTSSKPVAIQKMEENDSTSFDRDLYMRINKLTVSHDISNSISRDPFFVQEDVPTLSEVPITYLTINSGEDSKADSTEGKPLPKSFFSRFKIKIKRN